MPEAACLEMARVAAEAATGAEAGQTGMVLKDVVWVNPILAEAPMQIHIGLYPETNGEIGFEIYGETGETTNRPYIARGQQF